MITALYANERSKDFHEKMCVAIPIKLAEKNDSTGIVEMEGLRQEVSLQLLEDVQVGDYVIVHAGFAIGRFDESEAMETLDLMKEAGIISNRDA